MDREKIASAVTEWIAQSRGKAPHESMRSFMHDVSRREGWQRDEISAAYQSLSWLAEAACLMLAAEDARFSAPTRNKRARLTRFSARLNDKTHPFSLLARSAQPITHWYWGKVVHDMAGFKAAKPTLAVDYCHNAGEVLGYSNKFKASNDGLVLDGLLVQFQEQDRVGRIMHLRRAGVPYEASIFFDPYTFKVEEIEPGQQASVNGYRLAGPALIVREWLLRGVAICPHGADRNTALR